MKTVVFVATMLLAISSPVIAQVAQEGPVELSDVDMARVEAAVSSKLRDPESAIFSSISAFGNDAMITACGEVNAKNGMGGYTGSFPFSVFLMRHADVAMLGESPAMVSTVSDICRDIRPSAPAALPVHMHDELIKQFKLSDELCREDPDPGSITCKVRDSLLSELKKANFCKIGENWVPCQ